MNTILEIHHLTVSFTQYQGHSQRRQCLYGVRDLTLSLSAGEIVAVVGESGSGKSLLAHAILGLLPYNAAMAGALTYLGEPLTPARARALRGRDMALVPQGVGYLDPLMRVGDQLRAGRRDLDVAGALGRYGLPPDTADRYPFELSGGMARRVLIAAAVLARPRLVIADEPTPGLDETTADRVMGHFREMAQGGAAVLFITHDLALAARTADRVCVLRDGAVAAEFPSHAFGSAENLRDPYVAALWRAMPEHEFWEAVE